MAGFNFCSALVRAFGIDRKARFGRRFNSPASRSIRDFQKNRPARSRWLSALTAILLAAGSQARAQDGDSVSVPVVRKAQASRQYFNISAGPLAPALARFIDQSGFYLVYDTSVPRGFVTGGIKGRFMPQFALELLLACTGVDYRLTGPGTVVLERLISLDPLLLGERGVTQ